MLAPQAAVPAPPAVTAATDVATSAQPAKPNPDASGKYHVGDGVTPPRVIYHVEPEFSEEARKKKFSANVLVALTVETNGNPTNVHVVKSAADQADKKHRKAALSLDQKAIDAVTKYKFSPATFQGMPVPVDLNIDINFTIF